MRTHNPSHEELEEALGAALRGETPRNQPLAPKPPPRQRPPRTKITCHYTATDRWGDNKRTLEFSAYTMFQSEVEIKAQIEMSKQRLANITLVRAVRTEE